MSSQTAFARDLQTKIWRTSGARFNAARRLRRRERFSCFSIACFSALGIALVIVQRVYGVPAGTNLDNHYTFLALAISLFVLIISLIEGAGGYPLKAERLHYNAVELDALQERLGQTLSQTEDAERLKSEITEISRAYEEKIKQCPENHEPIDDELFRAQHRLSQEFERDSISWKRATFIRLIYLFQSFWLYLIAWIVIGSFVGLVIRNLDFS
jgi:hypothetical protein